MHLQKRVGAVATQNVTNPALGPIVLQHLGSGSSASDAVTTSISSEPFPSYRQLLAVDRNGNTCIHSGENSLLAFGQRHRAFSVQLAKSFGNVDVPQAVVESFEKYKGNFSDRLIEAMQSGLASGGEAGPLHSAGLLVVDTQDWPYAELRCDWTEDCPITMIAQAWKIYKPQAKDYVMRALNPMDAPSYGVPGDE